MKESYLKVNIVVDEVIREKVAKFVGKAPKCVTEKDVNDYMRYCESGGGSTSNELVVFSTDNADSILTYKGEELGTKNGLWFDNLGAKFDELCDYFKNGGVLLSTYESQDSTIKTYERSVEVVLENNEILRVTKGTAGTVTLYRNEGVMPK